MGRRRVCQFVVGGSEYIRAFVLGPIWRVACLAPGKCVSWLSLLECHLSRDSQVARMPVGRNFVRYRVVVSVVMMTRRMQANWVRVYTVGS